MWREEGTCGLEVRGREGAGGREGVHPGAPAAQSLSPQPSCPNTPGPAPRPALAAWALPSSPASLPWAGGTRRGRGARRGRLGGGELPLGSDSRQPQPPHPHDLHREGSPGDGGGEGLAEPWPWKQSWLQAPALLCLTTGQGHALTSALSPGWAGSWALFMGGSPPSRPRHLWSPCPPLGTPGSLLMS